MSGHSKWSTIKHKKALNDAKKGKVFSKVSVQITHAVRQGGGDPDMNPNLRLYIDKAKEAGFPLDKIEKAIQKGTGEGSDGVVFEEMSYEGFGPFGMQIIVDTLSDNKNRTVSDLRKIFEDAGGSMGETGSVSWNFETKGYILMLPGHMVKSEKYGEEDKYVEENVEDVTLSIMELEGILDIQEVDMDGIKGLEIYTEYSKLGSVRDSLQALGYVIKEAELIREPKLYKELDGEKLERAREVLERIEESDDVQNVWSDIE
ncbi:MAG: YebC/PmpR family DNA-binding transcriptional regulator [Candidatus Dojkabacteria bacterium]